MDIPRALMLSAMMPTPDRSMTEWDGYYISYLPSYLNDMTALVVEGKKTNKYYILDGDHRDQYNTYECLADCKKYFRANRSLKSRWSD